MKTSFNHRLEEAITKAGITQKQLANLTGITEAAVCHYLKGDRIPRTIVTGKMAQVLGCSMDYLTGQQESENFSSLCTILSRSAKQLSMEQKAKLAEILFKGSEH